MNHVYMTSCSLIRTYHQIETAKITVASSIVPRGESRVFEWLKKFVSQLRA